VPGELCLAGVPDQPLNVFRRSALITSRLVQG